MRRAFQTRALHFALDAGEPCRLSMALAGEGAFRAATGDGRAAARVLDLADALAAESRDPRAVATVLVARGAAAHVLGRFKEGLRVSEAGEQAIESTCPEAFWEIRTARTTAMWALAYMGQWRALRPRVERGQLEARYRGDFAALLAFSCGVAAYASIAGDDVAGGRARAEEAFAPWRDGATSNPHWWDVVAQSSFDLYEQRGNDALARLEAIARRLSHTFMRVRLNAIKFTELSSHAALLAAEQARGSEREGRMRRAESAAARLAAQKVPYARALGALHLGGARAARGERDAAAEALKSAIPQLELSDLHVQAAAGQIRLGWLLGGDEGAALVEAGTSWMRDEAIAAPEKVARFFTPGYDVR